MEKLKQISCDPMCGFKVQSHDESELIQIAKKHTHDKHNKDYSTDEIKKFMKDV